MMSDAKVSILDGLAIDSAEFLNEIVAPAIEAAAADPTSKSKAVAAAILAYHFKEWPEEEGLVSLTHVAAHCPFDDALRVVANAAKHRRRQTAATLAAGPIGSTSQRAYDEAGFGLGTFGGPDVMVTARRLPGDPQEQWLVVSVLREVEAWWRAVLGI